MTTFRKIAIASLAAVTLAAGISTSTTQAHAAGWGWGGPAAVGVVTGLALGAIMTAPRPMVSCWREERPVYRHGFFRGYRLVRVCD